MNKEYIADSNSRPSMESMTVTSNLLPRGWTIQIGMQTGLHGVTLIGTLDDMDELQTGKGIEVDMVVEGSEGEQHGN